MFQFQKDKCTSEIKGILCEKRFNGQMWYITVQYVVDGTTYKITEQLRFEVDKKHKFSHVKSGTEATSRLGALNEGAVIKIKYNPAKPKQAYIKENTGLKVF